MFPLTVAASLVLLSYCALTEASDVSLSAADQDYLVKLHNDARDVEQAKDMTHVAWDAGLASEAQSWTDGCHFAHQKGKSWGENLSAAGYSSSQAMDAALERLFNLWTSEKQYNTGGTFEECCSSKSAKCCHYTQVIWSKSTKLGCGLTLCPTMTSSWGDMSNVLHLACYYSPRGNKPAVAYTFDWRPYLPLN